MTMSKKTVADLDVAGKTVLMRADFNVPLDGSKITDDRRITQAMPSIKSIVERGGRLILMSHLGRPKGERNDQYSLKPVAAHLKKLLAVCVSDPADGLGKEKDVGDHGQSKLARVPDVTFAPDCVGPEVEKMAADLKDGDVLLLENLRFHPGEEKNAAEFAENLAKIADVYVNDAFGTAHREHASTFGAPERMKKAGKPTAIGFLIGKELKFLGEAVKQPAASRSSPSLAGPRSATRSTSSKPCWTRRTRCSSAGRWPTPSSSPRARTSAKALSSGTRSISPKQLLAKGRRQDQAAGGHGRFRRG